MKKDKKKERQAADLLMEFVDNEENLKRKN